MRPSWLGGYWVEPSKQGTSHGSVSPPLKHGHTLNNTLTQELPGLLPRLWRFALRLTCDAHDAEDLVQRACIRALEKQQQFTYGASAVGWLFAIMHSIWLNEIRARKLQSRYSAQLQDGMDEAVPDSGAGDPEVNVLHQQLLAAVNALPDAQRSVMLLVSAEGLSYSDAADILGLPIGTVMSRLYRARLTIGLAFGQPGQSGKIEKPLRTSINNDYPSKATP